MTRHDGLDQRTADRLVAGELLPDEVPPAYRQVAALLHEAAEPGHDVAPDSGLLAAMVETAGSGTVDVLPFARRSRVAKIVSTKVAVAGAAVLLSASGAAAATGSLPDAAQNRVAAAALHVGINLPDSASDQAEESTTKSHPSSSNDDAGTQGKSDEDHGKSGDDAGTQGKSDEDHGKSNEDHGNDDDATTTEHGPEDNHGAVVSEVARTNDAEVAGTNDSGGREHGETVSTVARTNSDNNDNADATEHGASTAQDDDD